jgi:hypothetical protein
MFRFRLSCGNIYDTAGITSVVAVRENTYRSLVLLDTERDRRYYITKVSIIIGHFITVVNYSSQLQ